MHAIRRLNVSAATMRICILTHRPLVAERADADSQMVRWDTWGRMVEPVAARLPWMVAAGNHEIENDKRAAADLPPGDFASFNTYQHRFRMPAEESSHGLATQALSFLDRVFAFMGRRAPSGGLLTRCLQGYVAKCAQPHFASAAMHGHAQDPLRTTVLALV